MKLLTQKAKFSLWKSQIQIANLKNFSNQFFDSASRLSSSKSYLTFLSLFIYIKHLFVISTSFQSHLIRHSVMQKAFKDTQMALKHSRHSESTRAPGQSEGNRKAIGHFKDTRSLLEHSSTWALRHLGTRVLGHLGT